MDIELTHKFSLGFVEEIELIHIVAAAGRN
jgi:hypothetical protein